MQDDAVTGRGRPAVRLYTAEQTRRIDRVAMAQYGYRGIDLMRTAGRQAFDRIIARRPQGGRWLVLCGGGNNGGDGYVVARLALERGVAVTVLATASPGGDDSRSACDDFIRAGGRVTPLGQAGADDYAVVVDAVFGTGLNRPPTAAAAELIAYGNRVNGYKVALDLPSGLHSDTGAAYTPCFAADLTVSFVARKPGLYTADGAAMGGERVFADLQLAAAVFQGQPCAAELIGPPALTRRAANSHKGRFGRILIAGGSPGMLGAALLAGKTALRAGSGLVTVLTDAARLDWPALYCAELMSVCPAATEQFAAALARADMVVLGPGLGGDAEADRLCEQLVAGGRPLLMDAGALRWLQRHPVRADNWILTPHPGEAAGLLGVTGEQIQRDRLAACREIARQYGGICVLKGSGTVVGEADGIARICRLGNPGMASAGMGDVLSGLIASLAGQGYALRTAAEYGVWLQARSADQMCLKKGECGLIASDVIAQLPRLMAGLCTG